MDNEDQPSRLLNFLQAMAISPEEAKRLVDNYRRKVSSRYPEESEEEHERRVAGEVADRLIRRFARMAAFSGGATALAGVVPGLGTAVAALGGAAADLGVSMKLQADMCMCLAEAYGWDLTDVDTRHLSFLIATGSALEHTGVPAAAGVATRAGVRMLRQYLKGAALQTLKVLFRKLGIVFTRKALERAAPFGIGVALGATANHAMTRYVGMQAKQWFVLDLEMGGTPSAAPSAGTTAPG